MIEDPPKLIVRRPSARPAGDLVGRFRGAPTGFVIDALGGRGALGREIRALDPHSGLPVNFCGVALTCDCGPDDNLAVLAALAFAEPGDVLVAATDAFHTAAVVGDAVLGMARNRGVAAFVTDGLVRDYAGIVKVGLAVFCAGLSPNSPARNGPGRVGLPVHLGGRQVATGDIVIGDRDGVVVVESARAPEVAAALREIEAAEADLDRRVAGGLGVPDYIEDLLASGQVRFTD